MNLSDGWRGADGTPVSALGEFGMIARLREVIGEISRKHGLQEDRVVLGIGDDTASLRPTPGCETLVTCDIQVDGRHFSPAWITPRQLGARCATINLSDIAAMGGIPRAAIVSLALGPEPAVEDIEELYRGMTGALAHHGTVLVGGNISGLFTGLVIDMTLIGEVEAGGAVRRDTAGAGDLVWVTGYPGSAVTGLQLLQTGVAAKQKEKWRVFFDAYLAPTPRVREGRALGLSKAITSMIDVSDGLIGDLYHMVENREVGIVVREESLPLREEMSEAAIELGRSPQSLLLGASDDYELVFSATPKDAERALLELETASDVAVWPIGEVVSDAPGQVFLVDRDGKRRPACVSGWDHFLGGRPGTR
jgi:thiamine-monophosphate kinase